jgi:uncharacterized cupin superfamily protein
MLQLDPPMPVITPKGKGLAHVLINYGAEFDLLWVVFQDDTGECWTYNNREVRAQPNVSMGRIAVVTPVATNRERPRVVPNE